MVTKLHGGKNGILPEMIKFLDDGMLDKVLNLFQTVCMVRTECSSEVEKCNPC